MCTANCIQLYYVWPFFLFERVGNCLVIFFFQINNFKILKPQKFSFLLFLSFKNKSWGRVWKVNGNAYIVEKESYSRSIGMVVLANAWTHGLGYSVILPCFFYQRYFKRWCGLFLTMATGTAQRTVMSSIPRSGFGCGDE